jgi:hypothetical protein
VSIRQLTWRDLPQAVGARIELGERSEVADV